MVKSKNTPLNPCASILIDHDSNMSAYSQVIDQIRQKIISGEIRKGDRLPASRQLAKSLGISRRMIVVAYENLVAERLLETRQGDGTYSVFDSQASAGLHTRNLRKEKSGLRQQSHLEKTYSILPLSPNGIDAGALSLKAWSASAARAQRKLSVSHLFDRLPGGLPSLKEGIAKHLLSLRGLSVEPSQIIITAGIRESLDLVMEVFESFSEVAVEDPCNQRIRNLLRLTNKRGTVEFTGLPVDLSGANFDKLKNKLSLDAVHVTPSHQYPMGVTLSFNRRMELIELAESKDFWILEDDYGAAVRYSGVNIKSLFELDRRKRTLYFGTLSNIVFANLHLSFILVPDKYVGQFVRAQEEKCSFASILAQAALSEFIESGAFAKHILELRRLSKANYTKMFSQVQEKLGYWLDPIPIHGGMNFAAFAKDTSFQDQAIVLAARNRGISPTSMSPLFMSSKNKAPGLLFGFMGTPVSNTEAAIDILRDVIEEFHP